MVEDVDEANEKPANKLGVSRACHLRDASRTRKKGGGQVKDCAG